MIISIIGASGVGKDTQAKLLAKNLNLPNISTGQIMRDEAKSGNQVAINALETANKGIWPSDDLINELLVSYIDSNCKDGFILTGYPRTVNQYYFLKERQFKFDHGLKAIIHLTLDENVLLERMVKQAIEAEANGDARGDTDKEIMMRRIKSYKDTIQPILDASSKDNFLIEVPSEGTIEEVSSMILNKLKLS